jgi:hypothetical protein
MAPKECAVDLCSCTSATHPSRALARTKEAANFLQSGPQFSGDREGLKCAPAVAAQLLCVAQQLCESQI